MKREKNLKSRWLLGAVASLALALTGCSQGEVDTNCPYGWGGPSCSEKINEGAGNSGTGGTGNAAGTGGTGNSGTGGDAGQGGTGNAAGTGGTGNSGTGGTAGSGGGTICDPGDPCNTGLLGICASGHCDNTGTTCNPDNTPTAEDCNNNLDDNCNGPINDGCPQCANCPLNSYDCNCDGQCEDVWSSDNHCSYMCIACGSNETCSNGECIPDGSGGAGGTGGSGTGGSGTGGSAGQGGAGGSGGDPCANCQPTEICFNNTCVPCPSGTYDCNSDETCENYLQDPNNCGVSCLQCAPGETCNNGVCWPNNPQPTCANCPPGGLDCPVCDGTCEDILNDSLHCGPTCQACAPGYICSAGQCALDCASGLVDCGGWCTNTAQDPNNCGGCGNNCDPGQNCVNGTCQDTPCVPTGEICDGLDNNCDGTVDNNPSDANQSCATGAMGVCATGETLCVGGALVCNPDHQPSTETCNGLDDDCDGTVDDNASDVGLVCDTGEWGICAGGITVCTGGVIDCDPINTPAAQDACNGLDNNCDSVVNGGCACVNGTSTICYSGSPGTAGVGECQTGTQDCTGGAWGTCNNEVTPTTETCDGTDENCDGLKDNNVPGMGVPCNTGLLGVCSTGTMMCQSGFAVCVQNVASSSEVCDSLDNDCDGVPDDNPTDVGQSCLTGDQGICSEGVLTCQAGSKVCQALNAPAANDQCNGLDDNCDGQVNGPPCQCENGQTTVCYGGPNGTAGQGECKTGTQLCSGGVYGACTGQVLPVNEVCNNKDDNCDGQVDNAVPGVGNACSTGLLGVCSAGTQQCQQGGMVCVQTTAASSEICDNLDNDCDGAVDDAPSDVGMNCITAIPGLCSAGVMTCQGGSKVCQSLTAPSTQQCNGYDEDCDGAVNDGCSCTNGQSVTCYAGPNGTLNKGECKAGSQICAGGVYGACTGQVVPVNEVCNGKDDDCDGQTDDNVPNAGTPCNTGLNGVCNAGTWQCSGGSMVCAQTTPASKEVCDGLDNDCDGTADDAPVFGTGQSCLTGLPGLCMAGGTQCIGGVMDCVSLSGPLPNDLCNGGDQNCDGTANGGCSCTNGQSSSCYTGDPATQGVGPCHAGTMLCSGGAWGICSGQVLPITETCDTIDNDCDGNPDDGNVCCVPAPEVCNNLDDDCDGQIDELPLNCCIPSTEICNGVDDDCDTLVDEGCVPPVNITVTMYGDSCYKAVHFLAGNVIDGLTSTPDHNICSSIDETATVQPGHRYEIWENDGQFIFQSSAAPAAIEVKCSSFQNPPDHQDSTTALLQAGYVAASVNIVATTYTVNMVGCTRYDIRITW